MTRSLLFTALLLLATSCGGDDEPTAAGGHATPEAAFEALKTGIADEDIGAVYDVLTPDAQELMAGTMIKFAVLEQKLGSFLPPAADGSAAKPDPDSERKREVLRRHGIKWKALADTPPAANESGAIEQVREMASKLSDPRGFVADMWKIMDEAGEADELPMSSLKGELIDVEIDGDEATAAHANDQGKSKIEFRRVDGGWRIHWR